MSKPRSVALLLLFSFGPYLAVSWAWVEVVEGGHGSIWGAFLVLVALRLFFSLIESVGAWLGWHFYGREETIRRMVEVFRGISFPKRLFREDDLSDHLSRLNEDETLPCATRITVREMQAVQAFYGAHGLVYALRMNDAADRAFQRYSPANAGVPSRYD
jgi:hypothetical protein